MLFEVEECSILKHKNLINLVMKLISSFTLFVAFFLFAGIAQTNAQTCPNGTLTITEWSNDLTWSANAYDDNAGTGTTTSSSCTGSQVTLTTNYTNQGGGSSMNGILGWDYRMAQNLNGTSTFTMTFSEPIMLSNLDVLDIDAKSGYQDHITFSAKNGSTNVPVALQSGTPAVNISGQVVTGIGFDKGKVYVSTNQPITELHLSFINGNGGGGEQFLLISDMSYCCPEPPCNAGTTAPALNSNANFNAASNVYTIPCGSSQANLSSITASNVPSGAALTFHSSSTPTASNKVTTVGTGTYYAAFEDATNNCFSPVKAITVQQETNCCNAGTVAPTVN